MDLKRMTEYLDSLPERGIPSVDCMICKGYEQIYRHYTGTTDAERKVPINGREYYLMFSMTKVITMTAVMQLIEQGKLSLEDEVGRYLPSYRDYRVLDRKRAGRSHTAREPLKLKYLLSMQSGLDYDLERAGIRRVLKEKGDAATTREIVDAFTETPLLFEAGTDFQYSLSHDVAAALVEEVSGMRFGEYLKQNIFLPLEMEKTFFAKPENELEGLADQFIYQEETGRIVPMGNSCNYQLTSCYESGGAGLISCTEDYAKYGMAMVNGGVSEKGTRILKPETIELMKQDLLCKKSHKTIERTMGRHGYGYGCGVQVLVDPQAIHSPAPAGIFGWDGAAGSIIIMDTENKLSLVYAMHVRNCGFAYGEVHPALRDLLYT